MHLAIYVDAVDLRSTQDLLSETSKLFKSSKVSTQEHLDAHNLIQILLSFSQRDYGLIFLGYMLGKRIRFTVDDRGMHILISDLPALVKWWRSRSKDGSDQTPL